MLWGRYAQNKGYGIDKRPFQRNEPNDVSNSPAKLYHSWHEAYRTTMSPFTMFGNMGFGNMFSRMDAMMNGMQSQMQMMQSGAGMPNSGQSFHSSFTSISYGGGEGQPKVYQSSSSTKIGPNGVKETQKSERNSVTGLQKMAIGHHIGERAHVIEKSQNSRTGEKEESQEFVNIEEDEAEQFNNEFNQRIRSAPQHQHRSVGYHGERHRPYRQHHRQPPMAIEYTGEPTRQRRREY
uniref:Myeloid leukemia factor 2 n=1 Tax=Phallusia mammillata TaxID=59560 RepID=A0A6F9DK80_9ASCI|nr:myeloid leukemia factor 2 [Phallusia mammillata]